MDPSFAGTGGLSVEIPQKNLRVVRGVHGSLADVESARDALAGKGFTYFLATQSPWFNGCVALTSGMFLGPFSGLEGWGRRLKGTPTLESGQTTPGRGYRPRGARWARSHVRHNSG